MISTPWNIGNVSITGKLVLAPMTKITDLPFRLLCRSIGANLAFTEMVNINAVSRGNKAALTNFLTCIEDRPLGIQLFGTQPDKFQTTAQIIVETIQPTQGAFFDINLECPDPKVLSQGAGAAS